MTPTDSTRYGLVNQGGFFSPYYLFELLARQHGDELDPNGRSANRHPLRQLYRRAYARLGQGSSRSEAMQAWQRELLEALGFLPGPLQPLTAVLSTRHHGDVPISNAAYPVNSEQLAVNSERLAEQSPNLLISQSPLVYIDTHGFGVDLDHHHYSGRGPITAATTEEPIARAIELALDQGEARWAILLSGEEMRLYRKGGSVARQYLQVNFAPLFDADRDEEWIAFWGLFRYAAFVPGDDGKCLLDRVLEASQRHAARIADDLRENLILAMEAIMQGILDDPANRPLLVPHLPAPYGTAVTDTGLRDLFEQTLYFLYRLLFVLYAESRDLLPVSESLVYRDGYSLEHLRDLAERPLPQAAANGTYFSETIRTLLRMLQDGFPPPQSTLNPGFTIDPFNGQLFDPARTHLLDQCRIPDRALHTAVAELSLSRPKKKKDRRERFSYADLGVDQLGSIYEGLLVYEPALVAEETVLAKVKNEERLVTRAQADENNLPYDPASLKRPGQFILRLWGGRRKGSGSYYTPQEITSFLVKEALEPLVAPILAGCGERDAKGRPTRQPDDILELKVCDPAMGSGAFLIQACRYLAEAYGQARMAAGLDDDGRISPTEFADYKRLVAERCLYGVDLNPMAVELAKVSLWLETLARGKPLNFLDAHLRCGNALIGAPLRDKQGKFSARQLLIVPDEALKSLDKEATAVAKEAARERVKRNKEEAQRVRQQQAKSKDVGGQLPLGVGLDWGQYSLHAIEAALIDYQQARLIFEQTDRHLTTDEAVALVHEKEAAFSRLQTAPDSKYLKVRQVCDLWCAIWFWPGEAVSSEQLAVSSEQLTVSGGLEPPTTQTGLELMAALLGTEEDVSLSADEQAAYWEVVKQVWREQRFFHWELEFPEVWREKNGTPKKNGGFDAVAGNPPWEKLVANEDDFFGNLGYIEFSMNTPQAVKQRLRNEALEQDGIRQSYYNFVDEYARTAHFFKASNFYEYLRGGHLNLYFLFVERATKLIGQDKRMVQVLPGGILGDFGTQDLREALFNTSSYLQFFRFSPRAQIFTGVTQQACLLISSRGEGLSRISYVEEMDSIDSLTFSEPFDIPLALIRKGSPRMSSIPDVASQRDVDILEKLHQFPSLDTECNVSREINVSDDKDFFVSESRGLPVWEGPAIWHLSRLNAHKRWIDAKHFLNKWGARDQTLCKTVVRDILPDSARRVYATLLPWNAATSYSLRTVTLRNQPNNIVFHSGLSAVLSSLILEWRILKLISGIHVSTYLPDVPVPFGLIQQHVKLQIRSLQLICTEEDYSVLWNEFVKQHPDHHLPQWTKSVSATREEERSKIHAEVEALVADLYGLSVSDFAYILATFPPLDRDMPALPGEPKSTITRDLALLALYSLRRQPPPPDIVLFFAAAGADISAITGPIRALEARVHEACKLGAVAYIPSGRGAPVPPEQALRQLNLFTKDIPGGYDGPSTQQY